MLQKSLKCNLMKPCTFRVVRDKSYILIVYSVSYICETERRVFVRMAKHKSSLKGKCHSSAAEHTNYTGHVINFIKVKILSIGICMNKD